MRFLAVIILMLISLVTPSVFGADSVSVQVLQSNLNHPWSLAFLPGEQGILISERSGQLRRWHHGKLSAPISGTPAVWAKKQGGLLDVALAPDFVSSRQLYLSYTESDDQGAVGAVVGRATLSEDYRHLSDFRVLLRQTPKLSSGANLGTRLAFDPSGYLWISFGDNFAAEKAQDLRALQGKILRLKADSAIPADNPFRGRSDARAEIWSDGMRNPQGLAWNPWSKVMWESEHGPRGGDEINLPEKGKNYGWPLATWGIDYSGQPVPGSKGGRVSGTRQPLFYWKVSPALSGMAFYDSHRFPAWRHSLFIGALKDRSLIRLSVDGNKVTEQQRLLRDRGERIRDVRVGPDGYLYVLTDEAQGKLLKVGLR
ncbi:oxidoreductase [Izhakiella australiensis]|uniref:Oxidoreductase n=2 Tax=Izhakiella australiensis TaxID=1926881 RepID=A0A1S8YPB2_9GAMM|nr:oxidoreductase [Izhakiella australiensis]